MQARLRRRGPPARVRGAAGGVQDLGAESQRRCRSPLAFMNLHPGRLWRNTAGCPGAFKSPQWHCIGPIQSNKARLVAEHLIAQTVDWFQDAQRLSGAARPRAPAAAHGAY